MAAIETHVYDFIAEAKQAALSGLLPTAHLHGDMHEPVPADSQLGIRISNGEGDYAPVPPASGQDVTIGERDVELFIVAFAEVMGTDLRDPTARRAARDRAADLARELATLFFRDPDMGGRVCNSLVGRWQSGYLNGAGQRALFQTEQRTTGRLFAVINFGLVFNDTGQDDNF